MKLFTLDISQEFFVRQYNKGVQLIKPDKNGNPPGITPIWTIAKLLNLPINVYFLKPNSTILALSDTAIQTCNFPSLKSAVGNTIRIAAKKRSG